MLLMNLFLFNVLYRFEELQSQFKSLNLIFPTTITTMRFYFRSLMFIWEFKTLTEVLVIRMRKSYSCKPISSAILSLITIIAVSSVC